MDRIFLNSVELSVRLGVPAGERALPQSISVDLEMEFDTRAAGLADDFTLTVDYAAVHDAITRVAASRPFVLIESLGEEMAAVVLREFPVQSVRVLIRKPQALRERKVAWAGLEIVRRRG